MKESFLSVVEAKRFLGREFLTWLVGRIEEGSGRIDVDGEYYDLTLGNRVVLEEGGDPGAKLSLVDEGDMRPELGAGLRRGKLLDRARLTITRGERSWELTLDGGLLTYDSLRCPKLGPRDQSDDPRASFENDLFLRLADIEEAIGVLDRMFAEFCTTRVGSAWENQVLPELRAWIAGLGRSDEA